MTKLLEEAIESVRQLTPAEQDAIARVMLDEVESEQLWERKFASSTDRLKALAEKAQAEHDAGSTTPLKADEL